MLEHFSMSHNESYSKQNIKVPRIIPRTPNVNNFSKIKSFAISENIFLNIVMSMRRW
jgi:hypothetical protein